MSSDRHVRVGAEAHLDTVVDGAVITCPAAFTSAQREALQAAATMAGIKVLHYAELAAGTSTASVVFRRSVL